MPNYTKIVELAADEVDATTNELSATTRFLLASLLNDLIAAPRRWFGWEDGISRDLTDAELSEAHDLAELAYKEVITQVSSLPVGTVVCWTGDSIPAGWLLCDGNSYLIADYPELADVLGWTFMPGGPDGVHFQVPEMIGRYAMGESQGNSEYMGDVLGAKLQTSVPEHKHAERVEANEAAYIGSSGTTVRKVSGSQTSGTAAGRIYTDNAGVAGGVDQRPPTLVLKYIIYSGVS